LTIIEPVDSHRQGVLYPVLLESLVEWKQPVRTFVRERPLVGIRDRDAPARLQGFHPLERHAGEVVHHQEHGARRPIVGDVVAANAPGHADRPFRPNDGSAQSAARLLEVMSLGIEHRLPFDDHDELLAITRQTTDATGLTDRPDHACEQRVKAVLGVDVCTRSVSAVARSLWAGLG
jgi:hypothetical protein